MILKNFYALVSICSIVIYIPHHRYNFLYYLLFLLSPPFTGRSLLLVFLLHRRPCDLVGHLLRRRLTPVASRGPGIVSGRYCGLPYRSSSHAPAGPVHPLEDFPCSLRGHDPPLRNDFQDENLETTGSSFHDTGKDSIRE